MVTFKVATEIGGSVATNFRSGNIIHLQLVPFQQGENLKICHKIAPVYLTFSTHDCHISFVLTVKMMQYIHLVTTGQFYHRVSRLYN